MSDTKIYIYNYEKLYDILNELSSELKLNFIHIEKGKINKINNENCCIISKEKIKNYNNQILLKNSSIRINKLYELINVQLISRNFSAQSKLKVGDYLLDVNSRLVFDNNNNKLKLTEKEIKIIVFLKNQKRNSTIKELQLNVWGYNNNLETHTVETHIHRLKKKFKSNFNDSYFITSTKSGYKLN